MSTKTKKTGFLKNYGLLTVMLVAIVIGCILGTLCALVGMLILAFLTGETAVVNADPIYVLAYLVIWSLPVKLLRGIVTRI